MLSAVFTHDHYGVARAGIYRFGAASSSRGVVGGGSSIDRIGFCE